MTTFVLIPGAGGEAWFWHRLEPELGSRGHTTVAMDLPADDDSAGLAAYADSVVAATLAAVDAASPVTVVAQSMGGLTAALVVGRLEVEQIIMLNAMTPTPGETGGDWWANTGQEVAARELAAQQARDPAGSADPFELYFHDATAELISEVKGRHEAAQSGRPFADPWPLSSWPAIPTRFLAASEDRLFPLSFQRRVVSERLGIDVEPTPGGHLSALTQPAAIATLLDQ